MGERQRITIRENEGSKAKGLLARLKDAITHAVADHAVEDTVDSGVRYVKAVSEQQAGKAAEVQAKAISLIKSIEHESERLIDERKATAKEHERGLYDLETRRLSELRQCVMDLIDRGIEPKAAIEFARQIQSAVQSPTEDK